MAWSPSPPPPEVSSFLQGRGWAARSGFVRSPNCKVNSPPRQPRPRARTLMHTHTHFHTHTRARAQIHTLRWAPRRRRRSTLASRSFPVSRQAGRAGRGAGSGEIDNRFGGLQRISLLEAKPHKLNPLSARWPRRKSTGSQNWGQLGVGHRVSATGVSPAPGWG